MKVLVEGEQKKNIMYSGKSEWKFGCSLLLDFLLFFFMPDMYMCFILFRLQETMDRLSEKLESIYNASGGKKINIISHSMGGLLVKCFMCLHTDVNSRQMVFHFK